MDNHSEKASQKRYIVMALRLASLLLAVAACTWLLMSTRAVQRSREEIAQIFQPYQSYGLIYNEKENSLYYDGELVRYFDDIISADYYWKWLNQNGTVDV